MRRGTLLLVFVVGCALPATGEANLPEAWLRVQQELSSPDQEALGERYIALEEAAREVDARRVTPYALALVEWAREHPGELDERRSYRPGSWTPAWPRPASCSPAGTGMKARTSGRRAPTWWGGSSSFATGTPGGWCHWSGSSGWRPPWG